MKFGGIGRFLATVFTSCLLFFVLVVLLYQWSSCRGAYQQLQHKLDSLSAAYALILAEPMSTADYAHLGDHTLALLIDKEISAFTIDDLQGNSLKSFGEIRPDVEFSKSVVIRFADESGVRAVGRITLVMNTELLEQRVWQQTRVMILILTAVLIVVVVVVGGAYRLTVSEPLKRLIRDIRRFQDENEHRDVPVDAVDQLGEVIREYNRMQRIVFKQRERLLMDQSGLKRKVNDQITALEQELEQHAKTSDQLAFLDEHDPLTELPNWRAFQERVRMWMLDLQQNGEFGAICVLALDGFKSINHRAGYHGGDAFLVSVAKLLQLSIRPEDFLARLGGDEFVLLMPRLDVEAASRLSDELIQVVMAHKFDSGASTLLQTGLNVGMVMVDAVSASYDEAIKNAERACDRAKKAGGNRLEVYSAEER